MTRPLTRRRWLVFAGGFLALPSLAQSPAFDHAHSAWSALLRKHVVVVDAGRSSRVRYAALAADRAALHGVLAGFSAVSAGSFAGFDRAQQLAFLVNAYNAFTLERVLQAYPKLVSIKDLGSFVQSVWKQKFIALFGATVSLDHIEQDLLRERGRYDDPRIHFALNCASVGCPALREEAFLPSRLDAQLDEQAQRFLADRSRNRWNTATQRLELSKIFDWYGEDFRQGHRGIATVPAFVARYADQLADAPADRERIRNQRAAIAWLDYDWKLNDATAG